MGTLDAKAKRTFELINLSKEKLRELRELREQDSGDIERLAQKFEQDQDWLQ